MTALPASRFRQALLKGALIIAGFAVAAVAAEAFLIAIFHNSFLRHIFPTTAHGSYYRFRSILQQDPECSLYDPELRQTLRPGMTCRFTNVEFDTVVRANALGLRDTDEALLGPDVIVLGDSLAMGWGVNGEETFAKLLERRSGLRVLNAGMTGYDTVSEMLMLKRLDASRLKYLVIQYCGNDFEPNKEFARVGSYEIEPRPDYERGVAAYVVNQKYFPGKYLNSLLTYKWKKGEKTAPPPREDPPSEHVKYFLNALLRLQRPDLGRVQLIVLAYPDSGFTAELKKEVASGRYPAWIRRLSTIDTSAVLKPDAYFQLDEHMTTSGHAEIAEALLSAIVNVQPLHGTQALFKK
jgi:lysophospholipase L1-like esterase